MCFKFFSDSYKASKNNDLPKNYTERSPTFTLLVPECKATSGDNVLDVGFARWAYDFARRAEGRSCLFIHETPVQARRAVTSRSCMSWVRYHVSNCLINWLMTCSRPYKVVPELFKVRLHVHTDAKKRLSSRKTCRNAL